jgi:hypothetical protein
MSNITYTWAIAQLDCASSEDGLQNVVKTIHWRYQGTDGTHTVESYGSVGVGPLDPDDFTPYPDLTQERVIIWLESSLDVDALQAGLAAQIAALITPPIVSPALPWQ